MSKLVADRESALPGDIIIPALVQDIDIPPREPSPWDDEFDGPLGGYWQRIDPLSTGYTYDADSTVRSCLTIQASGASVSRTAGIMRPAPPFPFTVTAKIAAMRVETAQFSAADRGIWLGEASPGAFLHGCLDIGNTGKFVFTGGVWTDPATFSGNIGDSGTGPGGFLEEPGFTLMRPHYARFRVVDANSVYGYYSLDGKTWITWLTNYDPAFTIGAIGLDFHSPVGGATSFDWFRVTTP